MSVHRTTTAMVTIAHPVEDKPEDVATWVYRALGRELPGGWGESAVAHVPGPQIVVTDEGSGDEDVPVRNPA